MPPAPKNVLLHPITWLLSLAAFGFVFDLIFVSATHYPYTPGFYALSSILGYAAACWVWKDSSQRKIYFPADLALLAFWIGFPAYLYEAKGFKGLLLFVGLIIAYLVLAYLHLYLTDRIYLSQFN